MTSAATKSLTVRMPEDEYETLKGYAFVTDQSINDVVREAVKEYLVGTGRGERLLDLAAQAQTRYRAALDKLAE